MDGDHKAEALFEIEMRKLKLEEQRLRADARHRRAELDLRREELEAKSREFNSGRFVLFGFNVPGLAVTLMVAVIAAASALISGYVQGSQNRSLERDRFDLQSAMERQKRQSDLIVNTVRGSDPETALKRLRVLVNAGLLDSSSVPRPYENLTPGWTPVNSPKAAFGAIVLNLPKDRYTFYAPLFFKSGKDKLTLAEKACGVWPVLDGRFVVYDVVKDPDACSPSHAIYAFDAANRCVKCLKDNSGALVSVHYAGLQAGRHRLYLEVDRDGAGPGPQTSQEISDGIDVL